MERREFRQVSRLGKTRIWAIEVRGRFIYSSYGEEGGKMQEVVDEGQRKNAGKANEVTPEEDALYLAGRAILEKTRTGYTEEGTERANSIDWNSTLPINLRFYKPDNSLSTALEKKLNDRGAWLARKRDGEMDVVLKGPDGEVDIYSRRMLRSHHLEEGQYTWRDRLGRLAREVTGRDDIPPRSILLGDIVRDPKEDGRWEVAAYMKSLTPETRDQTEPFFYCWDVPFWDGADLASTTSIGDRYALIWGTFGREWQQGSRVVPVEVWDVRSLFQRFPSAPSGAAEVAQYAAKKWGWEGWVVVDPAGHYGDRAYNFRGKTDRPGKFCGKLKPVYEGDFVAKFDPDNTLGRGAQGKWGTGNSRGQVGSVSLYQYDSRGELTYICECGSGIDDAFRAEYSDPARYPLVLQVEYTERTYKSEGEKTNALTYPRVVRVRDDKEVDECIEPRL